MLTSSKINFYLKKLNNFIDFLSHLTKILIRKKKSKYLLFCLLFKNANRVKFRRKEKNFKLE
jgi:hypothetical protein